MCAGPQPSAERTLLPKLVKPTNYELVLKPDLETFKFTGSVNIDLDVLENTATIVLHVNEVEITSAKIRNLSLKTDNEHAAKNITYDKKKETVTLTFPQELPAGGKAQLLLQFNGIHNDKMVGFYRSTYTDTEGRSKNLVVTQFEATDARRAFPCWDEPALKATFVVTLVVKKHFTALSNMNVVDESTEGDLKTVKFAKSPVMSTYLVAFAVGEFAYIEGYTSGKYNGRPVQCRIYTVKGSEKQGEFALDVKVRTLEYFAEIFDIAYPLPKCDSVAVPDFEAGAMENWGLITFRTTALLFDPAESSVRAKQTIAYTMAHELAHQWFGNYVSPEWGSPLG